MAAPCPPPALAARTRLAVQIAGGRASSAEAPQIEMRGGWCNKYRLPKITNNY